MSRSPHPDTTTDRRIEPGQEVRRGTLSSYRTLRYTAGENHSVRTDLALDADGGWRASGVRRPLLALNHFTDLQLADVNSPARFEFFNREVADPRFRLLVPTQRPYEAFIAHTMAAMVSTVNRWAAAGPVTGAEIALAVSTGDAIDNGQWNELRNVLALLDGGTVRTSGDGTYRGVQRTDWPDDIFWCPDADSDLFGTAWAYPRAPGALAAATRDFTSVGLSMPWLTAFGNHEALIQGVGRITPQIAAALVEGHKPARLPAGVDRDAAYALFTDGPQVFMEGPGEVVTPDYTRRPISRREFVEAHFAPGARPLGHGFGERNLRDGTAYYSYDVPVAEPGGRFSQVRLIALDTTCLLGGSSGALDIEQFAWLESVLRESHSRHLGVDGSIIRGHGEDRVVVLFSHHGLDSLTNERGWSNDGSLWGTGPDGHAVPVVPAAQVEALLHRYPNVVLWLSGHTHTNRIRPRLSPFAHHNERGWAAARGFWEVTTCSVMDWPCQNRVVELLTVGPDADSAAVAIACTMLDHEAPLAPRPDSLGPQPSWASSDLAALHRELAVNVPFPNYGTRLAGAPEDRNVILLL